MRGSSTLWREILGYENEIIAQLGRLSDLIVVARPARNMQMSLIRGGLHVSGNSDGTSLVVLPQQFSHCLRARDGGVRLVRANLMVTGVIFSGDIDTDIVFDYGLFTPRCRWGDFSDIKKLKMRIDARANPLSGAGLFPNWQETMTKLGAAVSAIK